MVNNSTIIEVASTPDGARPEPAGLRDQGFVVDVELHDGTSSSFGQSHRVLGPTLWHLHSGSEPSRRAGHLEASWAARRLTYAGSQAGHNFYACHLLRIIQNPSFLNLLAMERKAHRYE